MNWVGLQVTRPERTWFDLATVLTLHELVAAGDYLIRRRQPRTSHARLHAAFARYPGRRGRVLIQTALALLSDRAESPAESRLRVILLEAGLPPFAVNLDVFDANGRFLGRGDLVSVRYKLILEYEGDYHRTNRAQWMKDIGRVARLEDEGWRVIRVSAADLRAPEELIARIRRHIACQGR